MLSVNQQVRQSFAARPQEKCNFGEAKAQGGCAQLPCNDRETVINLLCAQCIRQLFCSHVKNVGIWAGHIQQGTMPHQLHSRAVQAHKWILRQTCLGNCLPFSLHNGYFSGVLGTANRVFANCDKLNVNCRKLIRHV